MDDRGWYTWDYIAINTPDETIKRIKEEEGEMGTSEGNLLMWMWGEWSFVSQIHKREETAIAFFIAVHFLSWWKPEFSCS